MQDPSFPLEDIEINVLKEFKDFKDDDENV